jgi:hypothetical protein
MARSFADLVDQPTTKRLLPHAGLGRLPNLATTIGSWCAHDASYADADAIVPAANGLGTILRLRYAR